MIKRSGAGALPLTKGPGSRRFKTYGSGSATLLLISWKSPCRRVVDTQLEVVVNHLHLVIEVVPQPLLCAFHPSF
jgi:hypothetical protein